MTQFLSNILILCLFPCSVEGRKVQTQWLFRNCKFVTTFSLLYVDGTDSDAMGGGEGEGEIRVGRGEGEDLKSQPSTLQIRFIMVLFMVSAISLKFSSDLRIILLRIYSNAVDTYHALTS